MFRRLFVLIFLLLIAGIIFLWLIKAPLMSRYLTKEMGVPVSVRTISMWPSMTTIRQFRISNPSGYPSRTAFEVDRTRVEYRWKALNANPHEIDLITLDDVFLYIFIKDASGKDNNWADIGAGMPERKERQGEGVLIHKLVLKNMTVKTEGPGAKALGVEGVQHFNQMEFEEIDSKEGFPTKELVSKIFQGAGLRQFIERFVNPTQQLQKVINNPFKVFGKLEAEEKKSP